MFVRIWWFGTGVAAGAFITIKALGRKPTPTDWGKAAARTGSMVLSLAAKGIRPPTRSKTDSPISSDPVSHQPTSAASSPGV